MKKPPSSKQPTPFARSEVDLKAVHDAIAELQKSLDHLRKTKVLQSPVFRHQLLLRLHQQRLQVGTWASGKLQFTSTEKWRTVYRQILETTTLKRYMSVALIRSDDYWRDAPGESSLQFNYELVERGFLIRRLFIIDDFFWPPSARTPSIELFRWIQQQHQHGIEVGLIRLSDLDDEASLACDIGIYGDSAVGRQETDFEGKTRRFELNFTSHAIRLAEQRWQELLVYAKPLSDLSN